MSRSLQRDRTLIYPRAETICLIASRMVGVGDGNRTHNVRSHSPVLCRLSYSHRISLIIAIRLE